MSNYDEPGVLHPDAADGDWIKRGAWDIWKPGYTGLIDNVADMHEWLAGSGKTVEEFKQYEVYKGHVNEPGFEWLLDL